MLGRGITQRHVYAELNRRRCLRGETVSGRKQCATKGCPKPVQDEWYTSWRYCSDCRDVMTSRARYCAGVLESDTRETS